MPAAVSCPISPGPPGCKTGGMDPKAIPLTGQAEGDRERRAREFATAAHARAGQRRKYTGEPYIEHPAAVVALVRSVPHDEAMLCAAWLHDVIEDCGVTADSIERNFGYDVAQLVVQITDVSKPSDGNRRARKEIDRAHLASACPRGKTIKIADVIHNVSSIAKADAEFARVYVPEKALLLELLADGDATLLAQARALIEEVQREN